MVAANDEEHARFETLLKTKLEYTKCEDDVLMFLGFIIEQSHESKISGNGHEYTKAKYRISVE